MFFNFLLLKLFLTFDKKHVNCGAMGLWMGSQPRVGKVGSSIERLGCR